MPAATRAQQNGEFTAPAAGTPAEPLPPQALKAKARIGKKAIVGYFSPELSTEIHCLAVREGTKMQALVGEALDLLLASRNMKPFGER